MITQINLHNFKSYRKLQFKLGSLNVLIGRNGAGKTNFLKLFESLNSAVTGGLVPWVNQESGMEDVIWWGGEKYYSVNLTIDKSEYWDEFKTTYHLRIVNEKSTPKVTLEEIKKSMRDYTDITLLTARNGEIKMLRSASSGSDNEETVETISDRDKDYLPNELIISQLKDQRRYPTLYNINKYLSSFRFYYDFDTSIDAEIRHPVRINPLENTLNPDGSNLTNIINKMMTDRDYYESYSDLINVVKLAYPSFEDFIFPATSEGKIILSWRDKNIPRDLTTRSISDGTLRFLCLCVILLNPEPTPLICIDEPEVNLHPKLVKLLAGLMEKAVANCQIIVATHSPELVSWIKNPENIVVTDLEYENKCSETSLQRLSERKEIYEWLKDGYSLGELWADGEIEA